MSNYCIISEFNPFHNGHQYLIRKARERGADTITCIMSGNATQRGELAIVDKYLRAKAAISCGADLVLELPYPWCSASAEYFASAGVSIASTIGDVLFFGSESSDIELLRSAAEICESQEFKEEYGSLVLSGMGSAAAYIECLKKRGLGELSSNDILGIAYIRAINKIGSGMTPVCEKRIGADYNCKSTVDGVYQSATALRSLIADNDTAARGYMPSAMSDVINEEIEKGTVTDLSEIYPLIHGFFRLMAPESLEDIAETSCGIVNRICALAKECVSCEEMLSRLKTKAYTDARIRRTILFCLTGVKQRHLSGLPDYTVLLGTTAKGRELLAKNRKQGALNIITKPADAPSDTVQYALNDALDSLYGLARAKKLPADAFYKRNAFISKDI